MRLDRRPCVHGWAIRTGEHRAHVVPALSASFRHRPHSRVRQWQPTAVRLRKSMRRFRQMTEDAQAQLTEVLDREMRDIDAVAALSRRIAR